MFYHFCRVLGHDLKQCAKHFALRKNRRELVCQYGDCLKANVGRNRSPSWKTATNSEHQHGDIDKDMSEATAVKKLRSAKPTKSSNCALNDKVNHGIEADLVQELNVMDGTNMECISMYKLVITTAGMSSMLVNVPVQSEPKHVETNLSTPLPVHMTSANQVGPQDNKPRPTWTRLACMDCEPRMKKGDITKPMLRK